MEISKTWLPFTFALLFASLVGAVTAVFFADQTSNIWAALTVAKAGLTAEYCELNHMEAAIRQPVNAWSNLCYTFLGAWTLFQAWTDIRSKSATNPMQRFLAMRIWIGLMLLGLGFGTV